MVITIRLKNFYSIREEAVLDFTAENSHRRNKDDGGNIIQFHGDDFINIIGLFGSNAAGKSNFIKAVSFCRNLILNSHLNNEGDKLNYEPFKFNSSEPSEFSMDFVSEGIEYEYSFEIFEGTIIRESLFHYPNNRRAKVFIRENGIYTYGKGLIPRPSEVEINTGGSTLFLSRASSMNRPIARKVYRFFLENILVGTPDFEWTKVPKAEFDSAKDLLLKAFEVSDSDIIDIRLVEIRPGQTMLQSFHRENPSIPFDFEKEESEGTKRLLSILLLLLQKSLSGVTIFFDEIDLKLHLRLAEFVLDVIRASHGAQLIFASHNVLLIDTEKLLPEQIVFVTKQQDGNSEFVPLSDFEGANKIPDVRKAYLQGRFDAVPYIGSSHSILSSLLR